MGRKNPRSTDHSGSSRSGNAPDPDRRNTSIGGAGQWTQNSARDTAHANDDDDTASDD